MSSGKFFATLIKRRINVFYDFKFIAKLTTFVFFDKDSTEFFADKKGICCIAKYLKISNQDFSTAEYRQISAIPEML